VDRAQAENGIVESRTLAAGNFLMIIPSESDAARELLELRRTRHRNCRHSNLKNYPGGFI
jgi:hypothetical protein